MEFLKPDAAANKQKEAENDLVFSYITLRNLIGFSGMLLPVILVLTTSRAEGDKWIEPTISDYYYSSNGDVLVVLLSLLGVFLFTYKGYTITERILTIVAALSGIGVAFSPTASSLGNSLSIHKLKQVVPVVFGIERHFLFAALFFGSLAITTLVFFPKTNKIVDTKPGGGDTAKVKRNRVYFICGWTMVACLLLLLVYYLIRPQTDVPVVFILETIAIEAFGLSWITKGQTLWPDGDHYLSKAYDSIKASIE